MTEYGTVIDKRNLATAQSVSNLNGRVSNLSKTTNNVKDIAESALKVATIEYAIGTETEATGEWQALTPKPSAGEYVWQRVTVTTGAGKTTQTTSLIQNIAALAQSTADTAKADAATAQSTADTAKKDAASAQTAAEAAQSTADTAQTTADSASSAASSAQSAASKAQKTADTATTNAAAAQSTADTAKADAATAQSTADTAKEDAATAQSGVDTLNTYIRSRDDGVEVARKDADGNYVGYKTVQTAKGFEVRTADDVVVAKYADSVQIGQRWDANLALTDSQIKMHASSGLQALIVDTGKEENFEAVLYFTSKKWGFALGTYGGIVVPGTSIDFTVAISDGGITYYDNVSIKAQESDLTFSRTAQQAVEDDSTTGATLAYTVSYERTSHAISITSSSVSESATILCSGTCTRLYSQKPTLLLQGYLNNRGGISTDSIYLGGENIASIFSGIISIGFVDKSLSIVAGGNTGEATISLSKDGYSARCICGWNLSGTGASNCTIARLYVNQTEQKIYYYVKNTGSSKATPTLRIYILYTKNN